MQLTFRSLSSESLVPAGHELILTPRPEASVTRGRKLALLALEQGIAGFVQGAGPVTTVVVQADPTLDDMIAATIVERLLAGSSIPAGFRVFATYAANVREGLLSTELPLQDSLEGIYLALRHEGGDLTNGEGRERFLAAWGRVAERIAAAAAAGQNPSTTALFSEDPEFARARAYLAQDRQVYAEQDVPRGERWRLRLPDGPPEAAGLLLRKPRSLLWKYWAREDPQAPGGKGYLFLAVYDKDAHWRFSTNPVLRVPIQSLAGILQEEEKRRDPARAAKDPWYDGKRHQHTLVAAPMSGTALSEADVLAALRRWGSAQSAVARRIPWKKLAAVPLALLLAFGAFWIVRPGRIDPAVDRGFRIVMPKEDLQTFASGKRYALLFATDRYDDPRWKNLNNPILDAQKIAGILKDDYQFEASVVENPTNRDMLAAIRKTAEIEYAEGDQLFLFIAGHGEMLSATNEGFIVASNSKHDNKDRDDCVHLSALKTIIQNHRCKHILLVVDTCFAGVITAAQKTEGDSRGEDDRNDAPKKALEEIFSNLLKKPSKQVITSCGPHTTPDGAAGKHSPFARSLIRALEKSKSKDYLTAGEIYFHYLTGVKSNPTRDYWFGRPGESDFLFIPSKK